MVFCISIFLFFYGCASVTVNPHTKEITYTRIGDQSLDIHVKTPDGVEVDVKQSSKAEALKMLAEMLRP